MKTIIDFNFKEVEKMVKIFRLIPGVYEITKDNKMYYRIYKNRWNGWTLAIFSEKHKQFINSRYFKTLKAAKAAIPQEVQNEVLQS